MRDKQVTWLSSFPRSSLDLCPRNFSRPRAGSLQSFRPCGQSSTRLHRHQKHKCKQQLVCWRWQSRKPFLPAKGTKHMFMKRWMRRLENRYQLLYHTHRDNCDCRTEETETYVGSKKLCFLGGYCCSLNPSLSWHHAPLSFLPFSSGWDVSRLRRRKADFVLSFSFSDCMPRISTEKPSWDKKAWSPASCSRTRPEVGTRWMHTAFQFCFECFKHFQCCLKSQINDSYIGCLQLCLRHSHDTA